MRKTLLCGFGMLALAACSACSAPPTPAQQAQIAQGLACAADLVGNIRSLDTASLVLLPGETLLTSAACQAAIASGRASLTPATPADAPAKP